MFITILVYHSKTPDTTLLAQVGPQSQRVDTQFFALLLFMIRDKNGTTAPRSNCAIAHLRLFLSKDGQKQA